LRIADLVSSISMRPRGHLLLALLILGTTQTAISQKTWKKGAYTGITDFQKQEPFADFEFYAIPIQHSFMVDLYRIRPKDQEDYPGYLTKKTMLFSDGQSLFLNLRMLKMTRGFLKIPDPRTYNYFMGRRTKTVHQAEAEYNAAIMFGVVGGLTALAVHEKNRDAIPYVFSIRSGRVHPLSEYSMRRLLEPYEDLYYAFITDPDRKNLQTMLTYLDILNDLEDGIPEEDEY